MILFQPMPVDTFPLDFSLREVQTNFQRWVADNLMFELKYLINSFAHSTLLAYKTNVTIHKIHISPHKWMSQYHTRNLVQNPGWSQYITRASWNKSIQTISWTLIMFIFNVMTNMRILYYNYLQWHHFNDKQHNNRWID